jgi:hypothetical protein
MADSTPDFAYEGEHEILGHVRIELTVTPYWNTTARTYINGMYVGKSGWDDATVARNIKGLTMVERGGAAV